MILFCFICKNVFNSCESLFQHFKYFHNMNSCDIFECGFDSCKQTFTSFKSLCKHMRIESKKEDQFRESSDLISHSTDTNNVEESEGTNLSPIIENSFLRTERNPPNFLTKSNYAKQCINISLKHYARFSNPRKQTFDLQKHIANMIVNPIRKELENALEELSKGNKDYVGQSISNLISICKNPFETINTEHKFLKTLKEIDLYESPFIITIDASLQVLQLKHINKLEVHKTQGILLPMKFHIRKFFELAGVYELFEKEMERLQQTSYLENFFNGKIWQEKCSHFENRIVIPYFLYFDDFETNNPLGSHCSPILGVYYSFPTAPKSLKYGLRNIFVAALFKSVNIKTFGNSKCFFKLIEMLNDLEQNGIEVETTSGSKKLYFCLGLIAGDNVALNNILGFARSFSATYFCRFCECTKSDSQHAFEESTHLMRTKNHYTQCLLDNAEESMGIREHSIFNEVSLFHVLDNFYSDFLHDVCKGVLKYDLCNVILHYINNNVFDLELLNIRKQYFNYGETEAGNVSLPLKLEHIKSFNLKLSGREMLTFAHFFPLIIGDVVPEMDSTWKFVVNLIELLDLLLITEYTSLDILKLKELVIFHNQQYTHIFDDTLKPKHHFLVHYCTILQQSGPLKNLWTFPFEAKHRELKSYAKNINSRRNLPLSLAIKYCISFSDYILNFNVPTYILSSKSYSCIYSDYYNVLVNELNENDVEETACFESVEHCGTTFKRDFIVFRYSPDFNAFVIREICYLKGNVNLLCEKIGCGDYKKHYLSYEVGSPLKEFEVINLNDIKYPPVHLYTINEKKYLRPKNFF